MLLVLALNCWKQLGVLLPVLLKEIRVSMSCTCQETRGWEAGNNEGDALPPSQWIVSWSFPLGFTHRFNAALSHLSRSRGPFIQMARVLRRRVPLCGPTVLSLPCSGLCWKRKSPEVGRQTRHCVWSKHKRDRGPSLSHYSLICTKDHVAKRDVNADDRWDNSRTDGFI